MDMAVLRLGRCPRTIKIFIKDKLKNQTTGTSQTKTGLLLKCLKNREVTFNTATILTSAEDMVCAWSAIVKGGLLAKFRAVQDEDAVITTMTTDVNEKILLVGDSMGMVYMWDIQQFGF